MAEGGKISSVTDSTYYMCNWARRSPNPYTVWKQLYKMFQRQHENDKNSKEFRIFQNAPLFTYVYSAVCPNMKWLWLQVRFIFKLSSLNFDDLDFTSKRFQQLEKSSTSIIFLEALGSIRFYDLASLIKISHIVEQSSVLNNSKLHFLINKNRLAKFTWHYHFRAVLVVVKFVTQSLAAHYINRNGKRRESKEEAIR